MANINLASAKRAKNDEFYTQYNDIQKEVEAYFEYNPDVLRGKTVLLPCDDPEASQFTKYFAENFERLGLRKLISTSYAPAAKSELYGTLFSCTANKGVNPMNERGRIFILDHDTNANGRIDIDDLEWNYLEGDGDFRSEEVRKLRDEADVVVTNPPFSLFREFLAWIFAAKPAKMFLVIGNMNAITYKEVFPLIMSNKIWLGATGNGSDMVFGVPKGAHINPKDREKAAKLGYVGDFTRLGNSCWFTNLEHGRRHTPMELMTEAENIKYSRHKKEVRGTGYRKYDNYDAIEVPFVDAIPSDFKKVMGVPISFLDKYCPEQFEIVGATESEGKGFSHGLWDSASGVSQPLVGGERVFKRIFIRARKGDGK